MASVVKTSFDCTTRVRGNGVRAQVCLQSRFMIRNCARSKRNAPSRPRRTSEITSTRRRRGSAQLDMQLRSEAGLEGFVMLHLNLDWPVPRNPTPARSVGQIGFALHGAVFHWLCREYVKQLKRRLNLAILIFSDLYVLSFPCRIMIDERTYTALTCPLCELFQAVV